MWSSISPDSSYKIGISMRRNSKTELGQAKELLTVNALPQLSQIIPAAGQVVKAVIVRSDDHLQPSDKRLINSSMRMPIAVCKHECIIEDDI